MSTITALQIDPLDVLFFRGSRPIGPNVSTQSGLPHPQTLAGALRTAMLAAAGFDLDRFKVARRDPAHRSMSPREVLASLGAPVSVLDLRIRGPWLCRGDTVYVPVPRTLVASNGATNAFERAWPVPGDNSEVGAFLKRVVRLPAPLQLPLWRQQGDDESSVSGFLTLAGLKRFLRGEVPHRDDVVAADALFGFDRRTGIGIDPERHTVAKGILYGVSLLALKPGVGFYAEVEGDRRAIEALHQKTFRFGGEARRALLTLREKPIDGGLSNWSQPHNGNRQIVVTVTPGWDRGGAIPEAFASVVRAASVGRPTVHSGFDVARGGPRATRSMVPAGSVFFTEGLAHKHGSFAAPDDAAAGEGLYVTGAWSR